MKINFSMKKTNYMFFSKPVIYITMVIAHNNKPNYCVSRPLNTWVGWANFDSRIMRVVFVTYITDWIELYSIIINRVYIHKIRWCRKYTVYIRQFHYYLTIIHYLYNSGRSKKNIHRTHALSVILIGFCADKYGP